MGVGGGVDRNWLIVVPQLVTVLKVQCCAVCMDFFWCVWQGLQARGCTRVFEGFVYMSRGLYIHSWELCVHAWSCMCMSGGCVCRSRDCVCACLGMYTCLEVVCICLGVVCTGQGVLCGEEKSHASCHRCRLISGPKLNFGT